MATRVEVPHPGGLPIHTLLRPRRISAGASIGLMGGLLMAAPLVLYDWVSSVHSALELPMATAAWLFGVEHFAANGYLWWPIVVGAIVLVGFWTLLGLAFAGLADRVFAVKTLAGSLAAGFAWSILSFLFTWYMLLPVARDGAPIKAAIASGLVAPFWVWVVGFLALGLESGIVYRMVRERATS